MERQSICELVRELIQAYDGDAKAAAVALGTSEASLSRWRSGKVKPRPAVEARLRRLAAASDQPQLFVPVHSSDNRAVKLEAAITGTLDALREEFHTSSSLSSRQEVLDLVAALFFGHVAAIERGESGIGKHLLAGGSAYAALNDFMERAIGEWLPKAADAGTAVMPTERFYTKLGSSDAAFADRVLTIFDGEAAAFRELHLAGRDDLMNEVFARFMSTSFVDEKEMGQYLTPPEIVRFMVALGLSLCGDALIKDDQAIVLDPSCGVGSFLAETVRQLHQYAHTNDGGSWMRDFVTGRVAGIDKSERMLRLSAFNLGLFGADHAWLRQANSLARTGKDGELAESLDGRVRLLLTNPPFGASHTGDDLRRYALARGRARAESELLFLERYIDWLAPNGIGVIVVPDSVLVNQGPFAHARVWLSQQCELLAIFSLPASTFGTAGTTTKTSVIVIRKSPPTKERSEPYFGIAREVGYDVLTRGGQRQRLRHDRNDLPSLLADFVAENPTIGRRVSVTGQDRWDAGHHAEPAYELLAATLQDAPLPVLSELAVLVDDRIDPRKLKSESFEYIEISDVDVRTGLVSSKPTAPADAPSRARKRVKAGDILVSTVRPERGSIGVVPPRLHGAICSTGFAVLRAHGLQSDALAGLLRTPFVRQQMIRHNTGIAYPVIPERACLDLVLPVTSDSLSELSAAGAALEEAKSAFERESAAFSAKLTAVALAAA